MLVCENDREAKRYFKMQSVHGSSVYITLDFADRRGQTQTSQSDVYLIDINKIDVRLIDLIR